MKSISQELISRVIKKRKSATHKGTYGRLLLIGGSKKYGGALIMAAEGALNSGAGLVTVATDQVNIAALHTRDPEIMALNWDESIELKNLIKSSDVVVCGMGLGLDDKAQQILRLLRDNITLKQTLILDASALDLIGQRNDLLPLNSKILIFTPHQMEWERLSGIKISDTQTGLRAIPIDLIPIFLSTKGERFEYEMNMLIDCKQHHIEFKEVPIQTIYFEKNTSSHFNPILDSVRIYMVFLKFIASSFSSFLIDIILFIALTFLLKGAIPRSYILVATILARIISSAFNYLNNKRYVFKSLWKSRFTLPKYYVLAVVQMLCSAFLVGTLHGTLPLWHESVLKIFVDTILFLLSFKVQQNWVFKDYKKGGQS